MSAVPTPAHWSGADDPAGPLVVTVGRLLVATDGLLTHLDRLDALAEDLRRTRSALAALDARTDWRADPHAAASAVAVEAGLDALRAALAGASQRVEAISVGVRMALRGYLVAERAAEAAAESAAGYGAALAGMWLRMTAPVAVLAAPWVGLSGAALWAVLPGDGARGKLATLQRLVVANPRLVTSPWFAGAVRTVSMHLDAAVLGAAGLPPPLAAAIGDERVGGPGPAANAAGVIAAGRAVGLLRESPVRVERSWTVPGEPARSAAERFARIPEVDQVRIERYEAPGSAPRFIVYVGPTETFTPLPTVEPWDLASNVAGVAGQSAGSYRATELAMLDAGITATSEVQFVGFSQGGLVAAMLAGSGNWSPAGLETYAAPVGGIALPERLPGFDARHTDDFVPAFSGEDRPSDRVRIEREAFARGEPPTDQAAPAHQRATYQATATAIDGAGSAAVRDQLAGIRAFTDEVMAQPGARVTVLGYRAERDWIADAVDATAGSTDAVGLSSSAPGAADAPRAR